MFDYERDDFRDYCLEIAREEHEKYPWQDSYEETGKEVGMKKCANLILDRNWYPHIVYSDDKGYVVCEFGIEVKECRMYVDEETGEVSCSDSSLLDRVTNDSNMMYMSKEEYDKLKSSLRMRCFATISHPSTLYTDDDYSNRFDSQTKLRNASAKVDEESKKGREMRAKNKQSRLESKHEFKDNKGTRKNPHWVIAVLSVSEAQALWGKHWKAHLL